MTKAGYIRLALVVAVVMLFEVLTQTGRIDPLTMQTPHRMAVDLFAILKTGKFNKAMAKTFGNAFIAFLIALVFGVFSGFVIHHWRRLREILEPLFATYYAIPVFAFYPMLILLLGLGDAPQIFIGAMLGYVAVVINTLNGIDRVPRVLFKTARVTGMNAFETAFKIVLPSAAPYVLTGVKFAIAYSLIGVIGAEFIMSTGGIGYEISFAYNNFENATMYPLIIIILSVSIVANVMVSRWEKALLEKRGLK